MAFKFLKGLRGQKNNANHKPSADELINEFSWLGDSLMLSFSSQSLDEIIEFKTKPVQQETVRLIQEHFGRLAFIYMHYIRGAGANNRSYMYRTELTLYGENGYTTSDPVEFMSGIMHDLPGADGFRILSYYYGKCPKSEQYEPFTGTIEKIGGYERFSYSRHERLGLHQHSVARFENGQWVNLPELYTTDIVSRKTEKQWESDFLFLSVKFDYEAHPDIVEELQALARKMVPEEETELGKREEDQEEEPEKEEKKDFGIRLLPGVHWHGRGGFSEIRPFLDEVNRIIQPIMGECEGKVMGGWCLRDDPLGVAVLKWTKEGFCIVGTSY